MAPTSSNIQWINDIDPRCLPPMSARKLAIYRTHEEGGIDPLVLERHYASIITPSTALEGTYSFNDPFNPTHGSVLAKNVSRTAAEPEVKDGRHTGQTLYKEQIESILFDGGFLNVNIETQYPLYVFLELHPLNRSNKFRDTTKALTAFFRFDIRAFRGKGTELAEADLGLDAEVLVRDWDFKKVLEYASSIPENKIPVQGRQPSEVKMDLRKFARSNPRPFFSLLRNTDAVNKFVVAEAIDLGFVTYNREVKAFFFYGEKNPIYEVGKVDTNPADKLLEYIGTSKGEELKTLMEAKINYWD